VTAARLGAAVAGAVAVTGLLAGCGGDDGEEATLAAAAPVGAGTVLEIDAVEMAFEPDELEAEAGPVTVVLRGAGQVRHDFRVEGIPNVLVEVAPGGTAQGAWLLPAGRYEVFCSLPGHREAGMEGTLTVR